MGFQGIIRSFFHGDNTLPETQTEITFNQLRLLVGIDLFTVYLSDTDHCFPDLTGENTFTAGKQGPGYISVDRSDILRNKRQRQRVLTDLIQDGRDKLIIGDDGMDKVFCRVGELVKRLFDLNRIRHMHKSAGRSNRRIPE